MKCTGSCGAWCWRSHSTGCGGSPVSASAARCIGNPARAEAALGWRSDTGFESLVRLMVEEDCRFRGAVR